MNTQLNQLAANNEGVALGNESTPAPDVTSRRPPARIQRNPPAPLPFRFVSRFAEDSPHRDAELFYLQKQIHAQTPMVIVLEDGEHIEGCIEWYDRNSIKVRGRSKSLIYKSAIKYMYKLGDPGQ
jgi:sRNA-binding regulator protein Hfq